MITRLHYIGQDEREVGKGTDSDGNVDLEGAVSLLPTRRPNVLKMCVTWRRKDAASPPAARRTYVLEIGSVVQSFATKIVPCSYFA
jgi:hypothetical protein